MFKVIDKFGQLCAVYNTEKQAQKKADKLNVSGDGFRVVPYGKVTSADHATTPV